MILLVVEGKDEKDEIKDTISSFLTITNSESEIVVFGTSIFELYDYLKDDPYFDLVSLLVAEKKLVLPKGKTSKTAFSEKYLVFDFEPKYQKYSDEKIISLQNYFNNETENGKLYINYPTFESLYDMNALPDKRYLTSKIELTDFEASEYKHKVYSSSFCNHRPIKNSYQLLQIAVLNYLKIKSIIACEVNPEQYQETLLNKQITSKTKDDTIFIINTLSLFPYDYSDDMQTKIKRKAIRLNS